MKTIHMEKSFRMLDQVCEDAIKLANREQAKVAFEFNDIALFAEPGFNVAQLCTEFLLRHKIRQLEKA